MVADKDGLFRLGDAEAVSALDREFKVSLLLPYSTSGSVDVSTTYLTGI